MTLAVVLSLLSYWCHNSLSVCTVNTIVVVVLVLPIVRWPPLVPVTGGGSTLATSHHWGLGVQLQYSN